MFGFGPEIKGDDVFTKRMRRHQGWYRDRVIGVPYGTGPSHSDTRGLGNMLTRESAACGLNFLTPGIFELAKQRIDEQKGAVEPFRLLHNMLSSQPMCFNLFGELARDLNLATKLARALWGTHIARVVDICFEWAPKPAAEYLNDQTAFDAFIEYETLDGRVAFIGIETKLSEPFSPECYDRNEYRRWMKAGSPWREDADVAARQHNQLWRNHLLAWSLLEHRDSTYAKGEITVVYHPEDRRCHRVIEDYRSLLRDEETFSSFDLGEIIRAWGPLTGQWVGEFERRYVSLGESEAVDS